MAKLYLTSINLNKNELQNAVVQNLASAPGSPVEGQMYYDTVSHTLFVRTNSNWVDALTQGGGVSYAAPSATINAGDSAVEGVATSVLRSDAQFAVSTASAISNTGSNAEGTATSLARSDHTHAHSTDSIPVAALDSSITLATIDAPAGSVNLNSQKITSLADGTAASDAVNKGQLDLAQNGLDAKASVRAATTANITISTALNNGDTLDGVTLATNDRVLVKDQSAPAENGIYVVGAVPARAADMDAWAEVPGAYTWVEEGTVNLDSAWVSTANAGGTLDTTSITWVLFSSAAGLIAGNGLTKTGNSLNVVGTASRISVAADAIDIDSGYVGQSSITTLGTITTGTWTATDIAVADGGTGSSTASGARTNLSAAGYYSSATHSAGTTISVSQATHGLRASRGLICEAQVESSGDVVECDISVASSGDVTFTFAASQSSNTIRVTIVG